MTFLLFFSPLTWKSCGIYFLSINSTINSKLPMLVNRKNDTDVYEECFKNPYNLWFLCLEYYIWELVSKCCGNKVSSKTTLSGGLILEKSENWIHSPSHNLVHNQIMVFLFWARMHCSIWMDKTKSLSFRVHCLVHTLPGDKERCFIISDSWS